MKLDRKIIFGTAMLLARVIAVASFVMAIAVNLRAIRRARAILLMPDGGFGHTISAPDWLRRLHSGTGNLTFFGTSYDRQRHNRLIPELWAADGFFWVRQGVVLPRLGAVYDSAWSSRLFHGLQRFLAWYVPYTPCHFSVEGLFAATPAPAWLSADSPFNERYESRYYPLMWARPAPALHVGAPLRRQVALNLKDRFGSGLSRRCTLYIRHRAFADLSETSSVNRLSPELDAHMPAIRVLNRAGYQVLLTGDALAPADTIAALAGGLVDWRAAGVDREAFSLFAGTEVDIHIGSLSGGSAFLFATDIPGLMLNAFAPGDALPRTTLFYKWVYRPDGILVPLGDLLGGMFYDHQLHGCRLANNTPEEMVEAVEDFIVHLGERPYGVDPAEIGIKADWIHGADARLSPVWVRRFGERQKMRREQRVAAQ